MPGGADADVVLLGVLALEAHARRAGPSRAAAAPSRPLAVRAPAAACSSSRTKRSCWRLPGRRDDDVPGRVHRAVVRGDRALRDRRDHLARADHRPPERVRAEHRLRRRGRARAPAACPRTSRSPRPRPPARSPGRRTAARRPCRSSGRPPSRGACPGRARRRRCARARWPRSARPRARRRARRSPARCSAASP